MNIRASLRALPVAEKIVPVSRVIIINSTRLISGCTNYDVGAIHRIEIVFWSICVLFIDAILAGTSFAHRLGLRCGLAASFGFGIWLCKDHSF